MLIIQMSRKPEEMFKGDAKYSQFDENGIPTHENKEEKSKEDKDKKIVVSKPINDKLRKKLEKEWNEQKGQYEKWLELQKKQK